MNDGFPDIDVHLGHPEWEKIYSSGKHGCSAVDELTELRDGFNDMTADLNATSEEIMVSVQTVVKAINEIAYASNDAALGTSRIAEKIIIISKKSHNVVEETKEVKASTNKLAEMCSKFKV